MANRLDIVTVGIKQECCIVVWMIVCAKFRRSIVNSVRGQTSGEECVDIRPRSCIESEVDARCHGNTFGQPEITARIGAFAMSFANAKADRVRTVLTQNIT